MKAMKLDAYDGKAPFEAFDKPDAEPGPNEVAIIVEASSVNPVDLKIRQGAAPVGPDAPRVLGCDVAGEIAAVGEAVKGFRKGEAVYGCAGGVKGRDGAYSQRMVCDARLVAHKPESLSCREAAALPLVAITAWEALVDRAKVQPGERVLVHGGAGGVGHIGVQLARAMGAIVHTTVSSKEKAAIAYDLGAERAINYREKSVNDYIDEETGGEGYDVVFDTIGGPHLEKSLQAVKVNGRIVTTVGGGASPDLGPLHMKNARLDVVLMLIPMLYDQDLDLHGRILTRLARMIESGSIKPLIDERRFGLEDVGAAHEYLDSGDAIGKIVIDIGENADARPFPPLR
ncbi:zinc-dependent alcohol dehydrogenase family protein [Aquisalinus flavus]|uniref:Quinone oxidoreductase n=1 Tax=Aquisalinus flavus TaxID=1526572 RepID=A0A8J2V6C3_9PROT|nr:zinc-dependent alcohol dehydrogenase family protein [Aquisalinus flavus]MBD0425378.1 zinc-dependent alcohol dehydrogenase family protein [Aquisalinus flavus]UNE48973.1 zinc-dependent alcohol dehydrogenase family protein [Aquisalinus flavus]GGD16535.1 quinone oxidoreductase [Aquisalinus flavus]